MTVIMQGDEKTKTLGDLDMLAHQLERDDATTGRCQTAHAEEVPSGTRPAMPRQADIGRLMQRRCQIVRDMRCDRSQLSGADNSQRICVSKVEKALISSR